MERLAVACRRTLPSYYHLPADLEAELAAALFQQVVATDALKALRSPDPSFDQFCRETWLEIALAAANLASSYTVCQVQDWADARKAS